MKNETPTIHRVFKTVWFAKAAKKARITDSELFESIQQVIQGQAIDLGGGVFKKRLNENKHRSIIVTWSGSYWVYEFLFAKKDLDNIDKNELIDFRKLAKAYSNLSAKQLNQLLKEKLLVEIHHE
ncbi:MAG: type II toxin-antitoxin system RelE/ParE family toxin [Tatlockia sp.]|nr:type II toxin-antitoxin system RelE/ParE family toxin [Tatlockia sp.]